MNKHLAFAALWLAATMLAGPAAGQAPAAIPDPNRVWVKFKPGSRIQMQAAVQGAGGQVHHVFDDLRAMAVTLPPAALDSIRRNPSVEYVESDPVRQPFGEVTPYGIPMVQAPTVWGAGTDGSGAKVCVIDSGVMRNHPDLQAVAMTGTSGSSSWDTDSCGHGTHVAGTIAAAGSNGLGVVGVNTGAVSLHIVKVFDGASCGWTYSSSLIAAAQACRDAGAKVISMSLGGGSPSTTESTGFQSLYDSNNILSIAAAGNAGNTSFSYPASYDSVVSVAAVDSNKAVASFSQKNSQVELAAPGVGVLSTVPSVPVATVNGTAYIVGMIEGAAVKTVTQTLVDGGDCSATSYNSASFSNKVVLCKRGNISFATKVSNVVAGGGVAAIIYNNVNGGFSGTLGTGVTSTIPAVSMSGEDGNAIQSNMLNWQATVNTAGAPGYAYYDGTSMATPHVSGVAALVWSANYPGLNNTGWTNKQVRAALQATAQDLGTAGRDTSYGFGLVQAKAALDYLKSGATPVTPTAKASTLNMFNTRKGGSYYATAQPVMAKGDNSILAGASVTGCFSGATTGCSTKITDSTGKASFRSGNFSSATASVTFCVTAVAGYTLNTSGACRTTP